MLHTLSISLALTSLDAFRLGNQDLMNVSAILHFKENLRYNKDCDTTRFWPPGLQKKYPNGKMVGSGATACVAIADYKGGGKVAIKVGKKGSNLKEWHEECEKLKKIRMDGCREGVLELHEQYIPTCIEVGQTEYNGEKINYYAMHAASVAGISALGKRKDVSLQDQKKVGAQVVASIYSMHKAGYAHNDLHGNNIVVDPKTLALQLIDLGDAANYPGWIKDYKRDGNAIWRWLGVMAQCPDDAQWHSHVKGRAKQKAQGERFLECIKNNWAPDDKFMKALGKVVDGSVKMSRMHGVREALYDTPFVKENLPSKKKYYPSDITKGCEGWSKEEWQTRELQHEFSGHFKCDQIPTYASKGRKGKVSKQCERGRPHKSGGQGHCFSKKPGVNWGCAGAIDWDGFKAGNKPCTQMGAPGGAFYDGGCLTKEHPGYRVAKNFG